MFTGWSNMKKSVVFTGLVLVLALAFSMIPRINSFVYMMTPTIATLLMMLVVTKDGYTKEGWKKLGLHKLGARGWPAAIVIPIIPLALSFGIVWTTGLSKLVVPETFQGYSWGIFPVVLVIGYIQAVLTQTLGEELGWRGYLLPNLLKLGERRAMLVSGFIHGIWHFPIMINTNVYHAGQNLWLLLPLTIISCVFLAPIISVVRLRTGSVWPASMMHTTHNMFWLVFASISVDQSPAAAYIAGDMAVVVVLFYIGLTMYLWRGKKQVVQPVRTGQF